ncbi:unnamed protein product [Linum trigynum]|uniref:Uncharacterized protein n=1 Tax=Linum trigynum TaxID=586398 RepID=A0AAV2F7T2_9ROSI
MVMLCTWVETGEICANVVSINSSNLVLNEVPVLILGARLKLVHISLLSERSSPVVPDNSIKVSTQREASLPLIASQCVDPTATNSHCCPKIAIQFFNSLPKVAGASN